VLLSDDPNSLSSLIKKNIGAGAFVAQGIMFITTNTNDSKTDEGKLDTLE